jgi:YihY family inner membrane protein
MFENDAWRRLAREIKNLFPLFRYLVLQTETHAFCLALACAALLGFFPASVALLTLLKYVLHWDAAYNVLLDTLRIYFPTNQPFVIRNMVVFAQSFGRTRTQLLSLVWVLLGSAGVFIPLETGFNRLWQVREDRPYWQNQIVGFTLTLACAALALFFVAISTGLHAMIAYEPLEIVRTATRFIVIRTTITCLFIVTIFALYRFLPNKKIDTAQVLPAAIIAGVMGEVVRAIFSQILPFLRLTATQGPFSISVSFLLLVYFETFVVLGGAFLASQSERYPWMGFLKTKRSDSASS